MPSTVILGSGIIGLSTAYYLSLLAETDTDKDTTPTINTSRQTKHDIHLVEPSPELFASASGKAAGFLAKDWFAPAVAPLGEFSFDLHKKLADEHGGKEKWGWSESVSYSLDREDGGESEDDDGDGDEDGGSDVDVDENEEADPSSRSARRRRSRARNDLDWLMSGSSRATLVNGQQAEASQAAADDVDANPDNKSSAGEDHPRWVRAKRSAMQPISDRSTTGQVDPHRLCEFLLQECIARGVKLHQPARATQLLSEPSSDVPSSTQRTLIRIQYLDPNHEAALATVGTPNSHSPPSEATTNGSADPTQPSDKASQNPHPADDSASSSETSRGSGSLWQSFAFPIDSEGSPTDKDVTPAEEEDYISYGMANQSPSPDSGDATNVLDVPCDSLVIAAGCWTPRVYRTLFPNAGRIPRVTALAGHSLIVKSPKWMSSKSKKKTQAGLVRALADGPQVGDADTSSTSGLPAAGRTSPSLNSFSRTSSYSSMMTTASIASTSLPDGQPTSYPPPPYPAICHAIFTSDRARYSPEIFSRLSGDIWVGGLNSSTIPLPALPTLAKIDPKAIEKLVQTVSTLLGPLSPSPLSTDLSVNQTDEDKPRRPTLTLLRSSLCFRPVAPTGRPVIARMHEADLGDGVRVPGGVFVATGHGPWGISLGLGTGWVVGEMVLGRETSVDVKTLGRWEAGVP